VFTNCSDAIHVDATSPGTSRFMTHEPTRDRRVELIKERLDEDLVDDHGDAVDPHVVAEAVDAAAAALADAPIQEFTPLLVEHDARDALREKGYRRDLGDQEDDAPAHDAGRDDQNTSEALHLSSQQGLTMPEDH
jgi:hypothetical protein